MRRFFVDQVRNGRAEISGDDAQHLTRVLRVQAGEKYEISDNRNVYLAEVETARKTHVIFQTLSKLEIVEPPVQLILCAALIKFDHFEWMIEKATELECRAWIVPVISTRTEREARKGRAINAWNAGDESHSKRASNRGGRISPSSIRRFDGPRLYPRAPRIDTR